MLYHVSLDGSAGPDFDLDEEPRRDEVIQQHGVTIRVYEVIEGADGSKVIVASRVDETA